MDRYFWLYQQAESAEPTNWYPAFMQRISKGPVPVCEDQNGDYPGLAQAAQLQANTEYRFGVSTSRHTAQ